MKIPKKKNTAKITIRNIICQKEFTSAKYWLVSVKFITYVRRKSLFCNDFVLSELKFKLLLKRMVC